MSTRQFSTWRKVAAFAPLLFLVVALPGQSLLRCRFDGLLRSACCCPAKIESKSAMPVVKAQDCCDRHATVRECSVVEAVGPSCTSDHVGVASVAALASFGPVTFARQERSYPTWHAHGPPREGPPLLLLKHAFLI